MLGRDRFLVPGGEVTLVQNAFVGGLLVDEQKARFDLTDNVGAVNLIGRTTGLPEGVGLAVEFYLRAEGAVDGHRIGNAFGEFGAFAAAKIIETGVEFFPVALVVVPAAFFLVVGRGFGRDGKTTFISTGTSTARSKTTTAPGGTTVARTEISGRSRIG